MPAGFSAHVCSRQPLTFENLTGTGTRYAEVKGTIRMDVGAPAWPKSFNPQHQIAAPGQAAAVTAPGGNLLEPNRFTRVRRKNLPVILRAASPTTMYRHSCRWPR